MTLSTEAPRVHIAAEERQVGPYWVTRHQLIGSRTVVYRAYEAYSRGHRRGGPNSHSTFSTVAEEWRGYVPSRRLPDHLEALPPRSRQREAAVMAYLSGLKREAHSAIFAAFPEAASFGTFSDGDVVCDLELVMESSSYTVQLPSKEA